MPEKHLHSSHTKSENYREDPAAWNLWGQVNTEGRENESLFITWLDRGNRITDHT